MLDALLAHFPAHVHPLTLVGDPDRLLADEETLAALAARGFRLLDEPDPVALRHALSLGPPPSVDAPLVIVTRDDLTRLPYDLWQTGRHVTLALHRFFPRLDYLTVKLLTPDQRRRLAAAYAGTVPDRMLSPGQTVAYLLRYVFAADLNALAQPGPLLLWLAAHHAGPDPLPAPVADQWLAALTRLPVYHNWPLPDLLADPAAFAAFVQSAWTTSAHRLLAETTSAYSVGTPAFEDDASLQAALPELVRRGLVTPVAADTSQTPPKWSAAGLTVDPAASSARTLSQGLDEIQTQLAAAPDRWDAWQALARRWAALTLTRHTAPALPAPLTARFAQLRTALNTAFAAWLADRYSALSHLALPEPHHLYHVPTFLAARRGNRPVALIVLDGMSLAVWQQIRAVWQSRRPTWRFDERLLLAQVPSVTAVSRQALIAGLPPRRFEPTLLTNQHEPAHWQRFWQDKGLSTDAVAYAHSPARQPRPVPVAIDDHRTAALCLVLNDIDDFVHAATQGLAQVHHDVALWLSPTTGPSAAWLEQIVDRLLAAGYLVALATDHGHTEAVGIGQPSEGVLVDSRSKRARLYRDRRFAEGVQQSFPGTRLWTDDGLLPPNWCALLPDARSAFAPVGSLVVSHGGLAVEELIVPFILVTQA